MEGCPYCEMMKEQLDDIDADYVVRDINEHEEDGNVPFVKAFVIEGLSFAASSGHKDILAGIYWGVRSAIRNEWPNILLGSIPVTAWRCKVLSKEEVKIAKATLTPKAEAGKKATVAKLPPDIHKQFIDYIEMMQYNKKAIYDLTDAYFLGVHRNSLNKS